MKGGVYIITGIVAVILAIAGLGALALKMIIARTDAAARAERDAYWTVEIEKSNAQTERALRLQLIAAQAADSAARSEIEAAQSKIQELEKANEALPDDGGCGLGRDRVRLLGGTR